MYGTVYVGSCRSLSMSNSCAMRWGLSIPDDQKGAEWSTACACSRSRDDLDELEERTRTAQTMLQHALDDRDAIAADLQKVCELAQKASWSCNGPGLLCLSCNAGNSAYDSLHVPNQLLGNFAVLDHDPEALCRALPIGQHVQPHKQLDCTPVQ